MARYDYLCERCDEIHEEIHGMTERPQIICEICGCTCIKLISEDVRFCGVNGKNNLYDFVDYKTTGQPVKISSKRQWKEHLRKLNMNDDVKNDPYTKSDVEAIQRREMRKKEAKRREIKKDVIEVIKKKDSPEFNNRIKKALLNK
jgi:predicted nucleic acid-binding Zn ribbon protein